MESYQDVFQRYEKKYLISKEQQEYLLPFLLEHLQKDGYGCHTILSLYYDTPDWQLIRASLERPVYKEKLRLRSYGTPGEGDTVFLELKKKFKGIVYKRRVPMPLYEAKRFLRTGALPERPEQILSEIGWFMKFYHPVPAAFIAYDRIALAGIQDTELRVTFDQEIRGRDTALDLTAGAWGTPVLPSGMMVMEVKLPGVMPLWMSRLFSRSEVFPASFSKYGAYYQNHLAFAKSMDTKGELLHA